jgi:hypothetical protein
VLDIEAEGLPGRTRPGLPLPLLLGPLPGPDRDVLDSARARLARMGQRPAAAQPPPAARQLPRPLDDLRAASAVARPVGLPGARAAEPLDVGAALVLLSNVRLYLDQLEARLLDLAQQADMSWDLIAAIIGLPAAEAKDRLAALHSRPEPM